MVIETELKSPLPLKHPLMVPQTIPKSGFLRMKKKTHDCKSVMWKVIMERILREKSGKGEEREC